MLRMTNKREFDGGVSLKGGGICLKDPAGEFDGGVSLKDPAGGFDGGICLKHPKQLVLTLPLSARWIGSVASIPATAKVTNKA